MRRSALLALLFSNARLPLIAFAVVESYTEDSEAEVFAEESRSIASHHRSHHRRHSATYLRRLQKSADTNVIIGELDYSSGTDEHAGKSAARRPIITGCLKVCGNQEQSCVTQCQVCMEQNGCRIDGDCEGCLKEARAMKLRFERTDKTILDSGGLAMLRDGLMAEMAQARLEALDRKRKLRVARENVLKAQREVEYATQERHTEAQNLEDATKVLRGEKLEVTRWKLRNEKKLKAARAKAREQRLERRRAERKLEAAKSKYNKARKRLRIASNTSIANTSQDEEEVWRASREVEEQRQAVEDAEMAVDQTSADGEWLDRGLQRKVRSSQRGAAKAREELLEGRARERVSKESLEETKDKYLEALAASKESDKVAEETELKLRRAPISEHPDARQNNTGHAKDRPSKSAGSYMYVSIFVALVVIGSSERHGKAL